MGSVGGKKIDWMGPLKWGQGVADGKNVTHDPITEEEKAKREEERRLSDAQPALPDLTDEAIQKRKKAQALMMGQAQGRRSTFLTGPFGDVSDPLVGKKG
jgi:hypothetical protein